MEFIDNFSPSVFPQAHVYDQRRWHNQFCQFVVVHPASKQLNGLKRAKQVKIHATSLRSVAVLGIVVLMKLEYSEGT